MIKYLLFDVDNTLLDFRRCADGALADSFREWGLLYDPDYLKTFLKVNDYYWKRLEDGEITKEELFKTRFVTIFKLLNINVDGRAFEQTFIKYLYDSCACYEDTADVLKTLAESYDLYIISNASLDEQKNRLKRAGLLSYFKEVFTSEDVGYAKPDKRFFEHVYEKLGRPKKEEVLVIGDSLNADIRGGKGFGFKTCWISDKNSNDADLSVPSLSELLRALRRRPF